MHGSGILVLGATGRTGRILVDRLIGRGAAVSALVRDPDAGRVTLGDTVRLVAGDLRDAAVLAEAASGCNRIVFVAAANGGVGRGTPREIDFGAVQALAAMLHPKTVERVLLLSSAAVTQPEHPHNCSFDAVLKWKLRGEQALRGSGLPYTIVRALGLRDRPGGVQGVRIVQGDRIAFGEDIARADVAHFLADVIAGPGVSGGGGFAGGFDAASLRGATCEIYNDAGLPGGSWGAARSALLPDAGGMA
jgi:uncharacterized protein YbjT (DUF2867 family)